MAELSQIAYSQGDSNVHDYLSQRLRLGYEYTLEYQVNGTVSYDPSWVYYGCQSFDYDVISLTNRYQYWPVHIIACTYYVAVAGASMPFTEELLDHISTETTSLVSAEDNNAKQGTLGFRKTATL